MKNLTLYEKDSKFLITQTLDEINKVGFHQFKFQKFMKALNDAIDLHKSKVLMGIKTDPFNFKKEANKIRKEINLYYNTFINTIGNRRVMSKNLPHKSFKPKKEKRSHKIVK